MDLDLFDLIAVATVLTFFVWQFARGARYDG